MAYQITIHPSELDELLPQPTIVDGGTFFEAPVNNRVGVMGPLRQVHESLSPQEVDEWLMACVTDPSILSPKELGWIPNDHGGASKCRDLREGDEVELVTSVGENPLATGIVKKIEHHTDHLDKTFLAHTITLENVEEC